MASVLERLQIPLVCTDDMSIQERVALVAPLIREACALFLSGMDLKGSEAFASMLLDRIVDAKLLDEKDFQVEEVGVHPDNREMAGLVAMDAHDLLLLMFRNGFNPKLLSLLGCEFPPGKVGDEWRSRNEQIAPESNGYLPPANSTLMKIATCWGSHTTASVRITKFGAKCVHEELDSGNGTA